MQRDTFLSILKDSVDLLKDQGWEITHIDPDRTDGKPYSVTMRKDDREWEFRFKEFDSFRAVLTENARPRNNRVDFTELKFLLNHPEARSNKPTEELTFYWAPEDSKKHRMWINMMFLFSDHKPFALSEDECYFNEDDISDDGFDYCYRKFLKYAGKNFKKKFKVVKGGLE